MGPRRRSVLDTLGVRGRLVTSDTVAASSNVEQDVAHLRHTVDRPLGYDDLETVRRAGHRLRLPAPGTGEVIRG